jgi:hypothetical protein
VSFNQLTHANRWLREEFADRSRLDVAISGAIGRSSPLTLTTPDPTSFGRTFEAAVQLDLCRHVPLVDDLQAFPESTAREMLLSMRYGPATGAPQTPWTTWRRPDDQPVDRTFLHSAASCIAVCHPLIEELRKPAADRAARRILGDVYRSDHHLRYMAAEAPAFREFMARYDRSVRAVLRGLGPAVAAPSLPGGRTADLLAGRTIVEIKAGWLTDQRSLQTLDDQLLGYGLLSLLTCCPATHVAACLGRYGVLVRLPLRPLLRQCAGRPLDPIDAAHAYLDLHARAGDPNACGVQRADQAHPSGRRR